MSTACSALHFCYLILKEVVDKFTEQASEESQNKAPDGPKVPAVTMAK